MNIAVIFAGGTGQRMNTKTLPKQFLEVHQKPIIIYTLEQFEANNEIDMIVISCLENWIDYCWKLVKQYSITKVRCIVEGGETGQLSIYKGLLKCKEFCGDDDIVLIHDGVRPVIDQDTISKAIECVKANGSAITVAPVVETIVETCEGDMQIQNVIDRNMCRLAKAPQCFYLKDILYMHSIAMKDGHIDFIDSASLMRFYQRQLFYVEGRQENIKITTPADYYLFKAILDAKENLQIYGI